MKTLLRIMVSIMLPLILLLANSGLVAAEPENMVRVIIGYDRPTRGADETNVEKFGGKPEQRFNLIPAMSAEIPESLISTFRKMPGVSYVEIDAEVHALEQTVPWGITAVNADDVHSYNTGEGVKVAVVDTGIDLDHPDLNVAGNVTYVSRTSSGDDDNGHGTHVAGIIAAQDNSLGVVGVAPDVDLYAVKVLDSQGSGSISTVVSGIQWAVNNGMDIISMSLGSTSGTTSLKNACDNAYNAGVLVIAAAGNSGSASSTADCVCYPAKYDSVVAVGAVTSSLTRASYSSTGSTVELAAPGSSIYSTYKGGTYTTMSGTSMATPHVTGVAALVFASGIEDEDGDGYINDEIRTRLQETAQDLGTSGRDVEYGYGLVDASAAVAEPVNQAPVADAGEDQTVAINRTVTLDGSGSSDPDGDALTYAWTAPVGVTLSATDIANPTFTPTSAGTYNFTLTVTDEEGLYATDDVVITVQENHTPVADAGEDQTAVAGREVTLDGSGSSDADDDSLTYSWTQASGPASVTLSDITAVSPTFTTPATTGDYTFSLTVNDGTISSSADTVTVTVEANQPPTQPTVSISPAAPVTTDDLVCTSSDSTDANGDTVTYSYEWYKDSVEQTGLTTDTIAASYTSRGETWTCTVTPNDGYADGTADSDEVTILNSAPVANAGSDQSVSINATVTLNGSASSDADSDSLTYSWSQASGTASVTLSDSTAASPTFTTATAGTYTFSLTVNDGTDTSAADSVTITVTDAKTLHVGSITVTSVRSGTRSYYANAVVMVYDGSGNAVSGVTVKGHWSGAFSKSVTGTTSSTGKATFKSSTVSKSTGKSLTFTFTIDSLTRSGYTYNSSANTESSDSVTIN